jgi:hypothetical protein
VFVPETLSGMELLEHFRGSDAELVFVVDEYGEVQGVITVRDLLEAITGEFSATADEDAWAVQRDDGSWLMDGLIPVPELKDRLEPEGAARGRPRPLQHAGWHDHAAARAPARHRRPRGLGRLAIRGRRPRRQAHRQGAGEENLFLDGPRWRGHYLPAVLRLYPFAMGRLDAENFAICIDTGWPGLSPTEGQALFDPKGEPSEFTRRIIGQLEGFEGEVQRTQKVGERLMALGLLRDMRFDMTTPEGKTFAVDGFMAIDEDKYKALPDDVVLELHRSGVLALLHAHRISLHNMRRLAEWKVQRLAPAQAPAAA